MYRYLLSLLLLPFLIFSVNIASAREVFNAAYGQWNLTAWQSETGNANFCALKTFFGNGATLSLRYNNDDGLTLVVFDPNFYFANSRERINIFIADDGINGGSWSGRAYSYGDTPNQLFVNIGFNDDFFESFKHGDRLVIRSPSVNWVVGMTGTRTLGELLKTCADSHGF